MLSSNPLRPVTTALAIAFGLAVTAASGQGTRTLINVATDPSYPPMEYKDLTSSKLIGFDIDLFDAIAAKMGAKTNWIETKWEEQISSIKTKRADVVVSTKEDTPEGRAGVSLVDYVNDGSAFYTTRANAARFQSIDDVCGKRVGAPRITNRGELVAKWSEEHCTKAGKPAIIVVGTQHSSDSRLQLNQGRIDAITGNLIGIVHQNQIENNNYVQIGEPFYPFMDGIIFSNNDPELGQAIKTAIAAVIADGTYRQILRKWKLPDSTAIERPLINGQP
ncbi:ABC transporter substrate-binding protein [Bradyrhizobium sp. LLZ17]|uniref:ABC transporter substrate-binding protein n=1 Tax=Bradyrhizobium sp. LLZ17 TaxID=3239388 RepID=A0AB39XSK3_9BRAD